VKRIFLSILILLCSVVFLLTPQKVQADGCPETGNPDIHIMVCYTADVLNNKFAGIYSAMATQIDLAIVQTNMIFENSGLGDRLYLVKILSTDYVEVGDPIDALVALIAPGAPRNKFVTNWLGGNAGGRPVAGEIVPVIDTEADTYGADCVCLLHGQDINDVGGLAGVGNIKLPTNAPDDPQMCRFVLLSDYMIGGIGGYTFAHEMGHSFGLAHDVFTSTSRAGYFNYSTGYIVPVTSPQYGDPSIFGGAIRGTVMSYADQYGSQADGFGQVLSIFSDPDYLEAGIPMGSAADDNVRTLETTGPLVELHRAAAWTLNPTSVTFTNINGAQTGNLTISMTTTNLLPKDGKIVLCIPSLLTFQGSLIDGNTITNMDGTFSMVLAGQEMTITRNDDGTDIAGGTALTFTITNVSNHWGGGYTGNFCFQTQQSNSTLIDHDYGVKGATLTLGPSPLFLRPGKVKDKLNVFEQVGCLVSDVEASLLLFLSFTAIVMIPYFLNRRTREDL